jgi:hypothetical protein
MADIGKAEESRPYYWVVHVPKHLTIKWGLLQKWSDDGMFQRLRKWRSGEGEVDDASDSRSEYVQRAPQQSSGNGIQTTRLSGSFIGESDDIFNGQSSPGAQRLRVRITREKFLLFFKIKIKIIENFVAEWKKLKIYNPNKSHVTCNS